MIANSRGKLLRYDIYTEYLRLADRQAICKVVHVYYMSQFKAGWRFGFISGCPAKLDELNVFGLDVITPAV